MKTAAILTRWQSRYDGNQPINIPSLFSDIVPALGDSLEDITEQPNLPPEPNLVVVKATLSPDTLAKIRLHPLYGAGAVLWQDDEDIEAPIGADKFDAIVRTLAIRISRRYKGADEAFVRSRITGAEPGGRSVADIINAIIAYLRFHPSQAPVVQPQ